MRVASTNLMTAQYHSCFFVQVHVLQGRSMKQAAVGKYSNVRKIFDKGKCFLIRYVGNLKSYLLFENLHSYHFL